MRKLLSKKLLRRLLPLLLLLLLLALPTTALADATPVDEDENLAVVTPADDEFIDDEVIDDEVIDDENVDDETVTPVQPDATVPDKADNKADDASDNTEIAPLPDTMEVWLFDYDINANRRTEVIPVNLSLGGQHLPSDVPAMAISGRTLVPVRLISENLQAQVVWEKSTNTVTITQDGQTIVLTIGSNVALINGVETPVPDNVSVSLVTHKQIARTMVPVRFVSENLGATVNYQQAERNVDIIPPVVEEPEDEEPAPEPPGIDDDGSLYRR
ncbi:MAG: copper amine oxidase N-terminal domain-containing protein, partial [Firmicutes bacterium]|nr:copper amine oxidase N-terminal domain-containing protein [Bacillota bacterium]